MNIAYGANFHIPSSDPRLQKYLNAAKKRASQAFRPTTQKNQHYTLRLYIAFANAVSQPFTCPSPALIIAFLEYLARAQKTAAAVVSTYTTLRALLNRIYVPTEAFDHPQVATLIRSIKINKRTPARQTPPVSLQHLKMIVHRLRDMDYGPPLVVAVLLMFATNFRQSNIAPPSIKKFDYTRHLTREDIRLRQASVNIYQKWSKTQQQVGMDRWVSVPRAASPQVCLVAALTQLFLQDPTVRNNQPLLTFDDGNPISIPYIYKAFKLAQRRAGINQRAYTLHSLRRGGACFLQKAGVDLPAIATHGGWRSNAIMRYVHQPHRRAAFKALKTLS